ncbi:MAG: hypothetical protein CMG74_08030 [Candidatus Marinimicrobia bacterium]|nr:hypothetical protein [Candidatus Neomarinimicrobiota bacterium]
MFKNKNNPFARAGIFLLGIILLNLIARDNFRRLDLTENKMYSLSNSSKNVISQVDDLITMKVYFSNDLPNELGNTKRFLQDILEEFSAYSKGNIRFFFQDPQEDETMEEQAQKDGIQPVQMQVIENDKVEIKKVYLGMVMLYENKKDNIPVIQSTAGLEYLITTKIKSLINIDKKIIGIANLNPDTDIKTDNIRSQLSQHYTVRSTDLTKIISNDIDVLLVSGTTDTLDTLIRSNMKSFLDNGKMLFLAQAGVDADIQEQRATQINSNIFDFVAKYGMKIKRNLVLDEKCQSVNVQERRGIFLMNRAMKYPFFPSITNFNKNEFLVSELEQVTTFFASEIVLDTSEINEVAGTTELFRTSNKSGIMENNFMLSPDPQQNPFIKLLNQKGKIVAASSKLVNGGEIILVADTKFLSDESGMSVPENQTFLLNTADYLSGEKELISLRSREITNRPLEELEDNSRKRWKWANMLLPTLLVVLFGFIQLKKEKSKANVLEQIYE